MKILDTFTGVRIADLFKVKPIMSIECREWFLKKHYARRIPSITAAFGLYKDHTLQGVCAFGMPPSPTLCESIAGQEYKHRAIELNSCLLYTSDAADDP